MGLHEILRADTIHFLLTKLCRRSICARTVLPEGLLFRGRWGEVKPSQQNHLFIVSPVLCVAVMLSLFLLFFQSVTAFFLPLFPIVHPSLPLPLLLLAADPALAF